MTEILKLKELPNDGLETSWGALWLGIRTFFGFNIHYPKPQGPLTEILKLKELPNDGLETSWGALWLGIQPLLCFIIEFRRMTDR